MRKIIIIYGLLRFICFISLFIYLITLLINYLATRDSGQLGQIIYGLIVYAIATLIFFIFAPTEEENEESSGLEMKRLLTSLF